MTVAIVSQEKSVLGGKYHGKKILILSQSENHLEDFKKVKFTAKGLWRQRILFHDQRHIVHLIQKEQESDGRYQCMRVQSHSKEKLTRKGQDGKNF